MSPNHAIAQEKFVEILQRILSNFYQSVGMGSTKSKVQTGTNQNCDEQIGGSEAHSDTAHTRTPHPTPATHKMMQLERQCFPAMDRPAQKSRSNRRNQTTKPRRDWDWSEIGEGIVCIPSVRLLAGGAEGKPLVAAARRSPTRRCFSGKQPPSSPRLGDAAGLKQGEKQGLEEKSGDTGH